MENEKNDNLRVARRVLPIELDGWIRKSIDVPVAFVGVLGKSFGTIGTFTNRKIFSWTDSFSYFLGRQIQEIGLVRRKFERSFWYEGVVDRPESSYVAPEKVRDWNVTAQLTIKPKSAGKFSYHNFMRFRSTNGETDQEVSIFDNEVSLYFQNKLNQSGSHDWIPARFQIYQ